MNRVRGSKSTRGDGDHEVVETIVLSDPEMLERLCEFLRAVHVEVLEASPAGLVASIPGALSPLHEQRELAAYLTTFNALNPGCIATLAQ